MNQVLAENIVSLRKKQGMSQEQLAEKLNVSRQAVSNWERGIAVPDVETLTLLAQLFDTDLTTMVNGESGKAEGAKDTLHSRTLLLILSAALLIVHLVLAFTGKVAFFPVVLVPGFLVGMSIIIHFAFRHTTAQNDFSIIAGYDKKKDNAEIVKKQLTTIDLLNLATVLLFQLMFFMVYATPRESQHICGLYLFGAYILTFVIIVVGVNLKMKSR